MNGAEVIAEILKREGTEFLSCYPRNPVIEPCAAIDIRPILCRQERVGVGIADGYSASSAARRTACSPPRPDPASRTPFPASRRPIPRTFRCSSFPAGCRWRGNMCGRCSAPPRSIAPVTKWSALAHSVQELPDLMRRAYHAMRSGKAGPVLIEVPDEVF